MFQSFGCPTCGGFLYYQRIQVLNDLWADRHCGYGHYWTKNYLEKLHLISEYKNFVGDLMNYAEIENAVMNNLHKFQSLTDTYFNKMGSIQSHADAMSLKSWYDREVSILQKEITTLRSSFPISPPPKA